MKSLTVFLSFLVCSSVTSSTLVQYGLPTLAGLSKNVSLSYLHSVIRAVELTNGNHVCYQDLVKIAEEYDQSRDDMKYVQYSANIVGDTREKTLFDFGSYRECMSQEKSNYCLITGTKPKNLVATSERTWSDKNITVNYIAEWMNHINISRKVNLLMGLCLPASCSPVDAEKIAFELIDQSEHHVRLDRCEQSGIPEKLTRHQVFAILFIVALFLLHLIGPLTPAHWNLVVFNFRDNFPILFNTNMADESIPCLYGLKSLSMLIVLLGNLQYLAYIPSKYASAPDDEHSYPFFGRTYNFYLYMIDTFFLISGFLSIRAAYSKFRGISNYKIVFARSYRFAALLAWTIALNFVVFTPYIKRRFAGPLWESFLAARGLQEACQDHWWSDLLLIDNWRFRFNQCTLTSWVLSLDIMYFTTTIYLILPCLELKIIVIIGMVLSTLMSLIAGGITLRKVHYPPTVVSNQLFTPGYFDFMNFFVTKPWIHGTIYMMGTIMAVYMKRHKSELSKNRQVMFTGLTILFFVGIGPCELMWAKTEKINTFFSIVYGSSVRLLWALAFCWIIFACHTQERFGILNKFLSHKIFIPLSRLNPSLLTTNFLIIRFRNATRNYPSSSTIFELAWFEWLPDLVLMYSMATISTLMVDIPFSRFIKKWIGIREKSGTGRVLTRPQIFSDFGIERSTISRGVHEKDTRVKRDAGGFYSIKF